VYDAIRRGQIAGIRVGRRVLVPRLELDRLLGAAPRADLRAVLAAVEAAAGTTTGPIRSDQASLSRAIDILRTEVEEERR
jgi:hypothetical protein